MTSSIKLFHRCSASRCLRGGAISCRWGVLSTAGCSGLYGSTGEVGLLLCEPSQVFLAGLYNDGPTHRVVPFSAHFAARDFVDETGITGYLLHLRSRVLRYKPQRGCNTGNGVHLQTEVRESYVVDHVAASDNELYRPADLDVQLAIFQHHIITVGAVGRVKAEHVVSVIDLSEVSLTQLAICTGVAYNPVKLLSYY